MSLGIPDDAIKSFLDPKNEIVYDCNETSPGCFEVKTTNLLMPTWNQHFIVKVDHLSKHITLCNDTLL